VRWYPPGDEITDTALSPILVGGEDGGRVHGNDERISLENIRTGTRLYTEMLLEMAAG
jgi:acetylornithine deacetylase/succinyl-diaminopimelate desuccinylase-like protein